MFTFTDNSDEVLERLKRAKERAGQVIGLVAETYAKDETPVDTGNLRNSITYDADDKEIVIGTNVEYAPPVELGHRNYVGKRMLYKAASQHNQEYQDILKASLENA